MRLLVPGEMEEESEVTLENLEVEGERAAVISNEKQLRCYEPAATRLLVTLRSTPPSL